MAISLSNIIKKPGIWILIVGLFASYYVGQHVSPTWTVEKVSLDVFQKQGEYFYTYKKKPKKLDTIVSLSDAQLSREKITALNAIKSSPKITQEYVLDTSSGDAQYYLYKAKRHWKFWSLLPAIVAILLCWVTKEPITALSGGIFSGAFLLGQFNILDQVLIPNIMTKSAASVLVLYLWLLGGLMGLWSKTGASKAFAEYMTKHFVRGPRTAKLVAWFLGVIFFQGGTVSAVLVGTTVKPVADEEKVSHEELSLVVDSTSSPIAILLAFNAWPGYVQAFIYVSGVAWLATEADRLAFFFKSIPLNFYAIFAVISTFLLSIDRLPYTGKRLKAAMARSRKTGQLDAPGAEPLSAKELQNPEIPKGYKPHVIDFFLPLGVVLGIAIGTYVGLGSPQVLWAFGIALLSSLLLALYRGMSLRQAIDGLTDGLKGVVLGSVILLLAITIGNLSKSAGGGTFLVELLGNWLHFSILPIALLVLSIIIAFSTGTSWGTFAVAFPLAMPLSYAVAMANGLDHPQFYMMVCFSAVLNGSVYGDQCSPISDTTILSSMCTGCDLMDHVKTQIPVATVSAVLAGIAWTMLVLIVG